METIGSCRILQVQEFLLTTLPPLPSRNVSRRRQALRDFQLGLANPLISQGLATYYLGVKQAFRMGMP